ncbi:Aim3p KNAG_0B01500 [Huiozyma naganishii CBS 8797]|uniref:Altered inheritance of mitochondria protein 3 n=1 Tax=Huiozyma naganishii (strain ATCC MYA-139 / BCRC 22969 / CBS 8797 / KCTC 17520 / NBRC 10181 / NCYC 3082 / Yp74L-3) TaxID=1071383 RepID=J7RUR6_HUIN7|nr:hypothetical protein KNAG_0B01500 [Kazachstania naganishii CBS 8797]CCK68597.1 hypothetical protein KNAG_0B01500 [Kazachstania naganishii CBS 8797]
MDEFWDKNKGSIVSGLKTAGKYGYQGTKYVAKTGYQASKKHYNSSNAAQKNRNGSNDGESDESSVHEARRIEQMNDPKMFPPPPLKPGQNQYRTDGSLISNGMSTQAYNQANPQQPILYSSPSDPFFNRNMGQGQEQRHYDRSMSFETSSYQSMPQQQQQQQQQQQAQYYQNTPFQQHGQGNQQGMPPHQMGQGYQQGMPQQQMGQGFQQGMQQQQMDQGYQQNSPQYISPHSTEQSFHNEAQPQQSQGNPEFEHQTANSIQNRPMVPLPSQIPMSELTTRNIAENVNNLPSSVLNPAAVAIGPQIKVKPFNREEYEASKHQKKEPIQLIDATALDPPPRHKYAGSATSSKGQSPVAPPVVSTDAGRSSSSSEHIRSGTSNKSSSTELQNQDKQEKAGIIGRYQEPVLNFAPPPKPHRSWEIPFDRNQAPLRPLVYSSKVSLNSTTSSLSPSAPPAIPKRSANESSPTGNTTGHATQPLPVVNSNEQKTDNTHPVQSSAKPVILGEYNEPTTSFAPPPKPHRSTESIGGKSQVLDSDTEVMSNFVESNPLPKSRSSASLSSFEHRTKNDDIARAAVFAGKRFDPNHFPVPPKPSQKARETQQKQTRRSPEPDLRSPSMTSLASKRSIESGSKFHGIQIMAPESLDYVPSEVTNAVDDECSGRKGSNDGTLQQFLQPSKQFKASAKMLDKEIIGDGNFQKGSGSESSTHAKILDNVTHGVSSLSLNKGLKDKMKPPTVKPKPAGFQLKPTDKKSSPPAVKPKPSNLADLSKDVFYDAVSTVPSKSVGKALDRRESDFRSRQSPPAPPAQRKAMPLPNKVTSGANSSKEGGSGKDDDDDINPFSIYKKEAVPAKDDTFH